MLTEAQTPGRLVVPLSWEKLKEPLDESIFVRLSRQTYAVARVLLRWDELEDSTRLPDEMRTVFEQIQFRLDVLTDMVAAVRYGTPSNLPVRECGIHDEILTWKGEPAPEVGEWGIASLYLDEFFREPLRIPGFVLEHEDAGPLADARTAVQIQGLSDQAKEALDRVVFIEHRRAVAADREHELEIETLRRPV